MGSKIQTILFGLMIAVGAGMVFVAAVLAAVFLV